MTITSSEERKRKKNPFYAVRAEMPPWPSDTRPNNASIFDASFTYSRDLWRFARHLYGFFDLLTSDIWCPSSEHGRFPGGSTWDWYTSPSGSCTTYCKISLRKHFRGKFEKKCRQYTGPNHKSILMHLFSQGLVSFQWVWRPYFLKPLCSHLEKSQQVSAAPQLGFLSFIHLTHTPLPALC